MLLRGNPHLIGCARSHAGAWEREVPKHMVRRALLAQRTSATQEKIFVIKGVTAGLGRRPPAAGAECGLIAV